MTPITYSCQEIVALVTEYLERGLTPEERLAFEQHVMICPPCRGHLSQLRRLIAAAPSLRGDDLPPSLRARLEEAFDSWKPRP
jgi:hypothetical protein